MDQDRNELLSILEEAIALVARPDNDFAWCSWDGPKEAISELSEYVDETRFGDLHCLPKLKVIFAPTGPLQELSLSSGWGQAFLSLADRFDQVINLRGL